MRYRYLLIVASLLIAITAARPASAILPFYNAFKKDYLEKLEDKKFAEEVNKASNRCFLCHQGKNRKNRNALGKELAKLLNNKKDAKDAEKISASHQEGARNARRPEGRQERDLSRSAERQQVAGR